MAASMRVIQLPVDPLVRALWVLLAFVVLMHGLLAALPPFHFEGRALLYRSFNPNEESSLPTALAVAILGLCAVNAWANGRGALQDARLWNGLALLFGVAAIDEIAAIHEALSSPIRESLGVSGAFHYAWVIPAVLLLALLVPFYARFVVRLPPRVRLLLLAGAGVFVAGAIGLEMFGGSIVARTGRDTPLYEFVNSYEEVLELTGAMLMLQSLVLFSNPSPDLSGRKNERVPGP